MRSNRRVRSIALCVVLLLLVVRVLAQVPIAPTNVTVNAQLALPAIQGLSTSSGLVGATVIVHGDNFGQIQGTSTVTFNGTAATVSSWSVVTLVTTVPVGASSGNVVVTVAGHASNPSGFTVLVPPPTVTITVPTASPTYDAGTASAIAVSGTAASQGTFSGCAWTNSLGGSGATTGTTNWTVSSLPLFVGSNTVTVTCTDTQSQTGNDIITITRSSGGAPTNPIVASRLACGDTTLPNPCWSAAGVVGGIPTTWTNCTNAACVTLCPNVLSGTGSPTCAAGSVSEATIENAVNGAPDNTVVWLPSGSYNVTGIRLSNSNTILRGHGASVTRLVVTSQTDETCSVGSFAQLFNVCSNGVNIGSAAPDNTATWTATSYAQGATTITLSGHTNLRVGGPIWLDQIDDFADTHVIASSDGYPGAGDVVLEPWGNGAVFARTGRTLVEGHLVLTCGTAVAGAACTSNTITIDSGLFAPIWRAAKTPGAWWASDASRIDWVGVEDLTLDSNGDTAALLTFINATNTWAKGVRLVTADAPGSGARLFPLVNCLHCEIRDSYLSGPETSQLINNYGFAPIIMSQTRVENNIFAAALAPMVLDGPSWGNVFAYNITEGQSIATQGASFVQHTTSGFNLFEGNQLGFISFDNIHAPAYFDTLLRNHLDGAARNTSPPESHAAINIYSMHRFYNVLGNVAGSNAVWSTYERDCSTPPTCTSSSIGYDNVIFGLGWEGTNSGAVPITPDDTRVKATLVRWGNWDAVTSTNDNGTNDLTGLKWLAADVPSGITNFANPVPGAQTVPTSYLFAAKPSWFPAAVPWPPIGPDVANSNIVTATGGHANKIPAKACWDSLANDTTYYNLSTPAVKAFDRVTCYGA